MMLVSLLDCYTVSETLFPFVHVSKSCVPRVRSTYTYTTFLDTPHRESPICSIAHELLLAYIILITISLNVTTGNCPFSI